MPLVLSDQKRNLYVYIYFDDHEPSHVHVFIGRKKSWDQENVKINLGDDENAPEIIKVNPSFDKKFIKEALLLIVNNKDLLLEKWRDIHGEKEMDDGRSDG
ncbi:DUF4160 domain-containing protein [Floridanema evergladense]|uniref:DUF4160 domain-containing protein n=1 Tax=Floridaenema evergladense BLCC-F167 TaxID=3153639 RepID=A0ABV4WEM5_9CYAN